MNGVLNGFVVGVTADRRSREQISLLEGRGAECLHGPTIHTHPVLPEKKITSVTSDLIENPPTALVAQTAVGMRGWFEAAEACGLAEKLLASLENVRVFSRGRKAMGAAITAGLPVEWAAATPTAAEVLAHLRTELEVGTRIAVQNDGSPTSWLAGQLRAGGFDVIEIPVYRWSMPADTAPAEVLIRAVIEHRVDAVTFTSAPAIDHLIAIAEAESVAGDLLEAFQQRVLPVCVGPVCGARAVARGLGEPIEPARYRLGSMVQQLTDALVSQVLVFRLAGHELELRGRAVHGLDEPVTLAGRERELLCALLVQPGSVHSKDALLGKVWDSNEANGHVVEVTIGRLRRRLGATGVGIQTVVKRGYRVSAE